MRCRVRPPRSLPGSARSSITCSGPGGCDLRAHEPLSLRREEGCGRGGRPRAFGRKEVAAGETYSTATFLGASGGAYSLGDVALWTTGYGTIAYAFGYLYLPTLWTYARDHNLVTQADFFQHRFGSRWIGALFGIVGVAFMIPYIEVQLLGFGQIVQVTSGGALPRDVSMLLAFAVVAIFVSLAGMNATAMVAILKDILMILAIGIVGIYLPLHYFGSYITVVDKVLAKYPGLFALQGHTIQHTPLWMMSTLLVSGAAFFMFPHATAAIFSAKSAETVRRNMVFLPFYNILLFLPVLVGMTALLVTPGLTGSDTNAALLNLSVAALPPWVAGLVGAAGALSAMVPVSLLVLQSATQLSKNVYKAAFRPQTGERTVLSLSKWLVFAVMAVSLLLALTSPTLLVNLLQIGQAGVSQFLPAIVLGLFWKRLNRAAMLVGMLVGVAIVSWSVITTTPVVFGMNVGLVALAINVVITVGGSAIRPGHAPADDKKVGAAAILG
ncbi:sodium:solute symporter family protein [Microbacterium sp. ASV49]|uniref:Sodium:solute symporter family protein n=1 Tax=Microbacterium candidum TaxID=3041922 RepID=A0ABT7N0J4_9MICO|nr:sodium:solute symporter family protein [Microbacterium sp. ASV49]MDL9980228.1 sodium:solute symporter family protein [Microbacterium sp. ASV49]